MASFTDIVASGAGAVGGVLGALTGQAGIDQAATDAAAATKFEPFNIKSGVGSVTATDGLFTTTLDPRLAAIRDQLFGVGEQQLDEFGSFNVDETASNISQRLQKLAAPREQKQRLALENRLFKQGILSSDPGFGQFGELLQAQGLAQTGREVESFGLAEQLKGGLFNRATQAFAGGTSLEQLPLNLLNQSIQAGGAQSAAGAAGGAFTFQAAQTQSDLISSFFGGVGAGAGKALFGG